MEKLFVIGGGPGGEAFISPKGKEELKRAQRILNARELPLKELLSELKVTINGVSAVLVSGDCGFFSLAKTITADFAGLYDIELIPGISSIQYLSAKIKEPWDGAAIISLHGRRRSIVPWVCYNRRVFSLTGGENSAGEICRILCRHGLGGVAVSIGERLSFRDERILCGSAYELAEKEFDSLSVMYIENNAAVNPHIPLKDGDFIRGGAPMTKEEIRWLSIGKLGIRPGDVIYDIGAGTGSVSVEMARKAFEGFVYAIEAKKDACALIKENAAKHGAFNMEIINAEAPEGIYGLPKPDKAFIGGGSQVMEKVVCLLKELNPRISITANAITLETINRITESFKKYGLTDTDIICVNVAKSKTAGEYHMMTAQNPVYIITGKAGGGE